MKLFNSISIPSFYSRIALTLALAFLPSICILAASAERYAASSALSSGNWVKIDISSPGLQTLSRQTLKNFGFNDPQRVFVYGYGGRMISEALTTDHPDDLPPVPVVRKDDGSITFFATGNITPLASSSPAMRYSHTINPYAETSYYFLSDVAPTGETKVTDLSYAGTDAEDTFICQLVHEAELLQCASSGRDYLGEDFKANKSQIFKFDLPDNYNGNARIRVRFGTNTSGGSSSIMVSANGERLPATAEDNIPEVSASDQYYRLTTSTKEAEGVGNSLNVGIEYSQGGVVSTARLDWIEVEYERKLALRDSQLHFMVNPSSPTAYRISGASEQTTVWDVTKPWDIREVKGTFDAAAKTITIRLNESGLREFVAFDPTAKGANIPGRFKTANQNIHGLPTPHMVIITPDAFSEAAGRIADLHRTHDGMTVHVLSPEKIFNEFSSGNADVSAFRKLLKMWYDRSQEDPEGNQFGYCLLMGRPTFDQKFKNPETIKSGYPRTLIWQSPDALTETTSYGTDDFIAMLEDETSVRPMSGRKLLVAVGRYTVSSASEAETVVDKLEAYMASPIYGTWRNNIMVIADDGDTAQHLEQAQKAIANMQSNPVGSNYSYERIYLDAFERKQTGKGLTFPGAKQRMLDKWQKEGTAFINYIGHANPKEWTHEKLLTWNEITALSNQYLPILYAATCNFGKWDDTDESGAELMLSNPTGGAIAIITPSRTVYISRNLYITNSVSQELTARDSDGKGKRIGEILRLGKNNSASPDDNMLRYHLFGDPALRVPLPTMSARVDSIDGSPLPENLNDAPILKARSAVRIAGRITDPDGNDVDFNGPIHFTLFDAEKSVTTYGWGESGKVSVYQDRSTKLATGCATATGGKWSATILMPSEITNNFSPALLTLYAYDPETKAEANGSTDRLYVYGYDDNITEDTEGPVIESLRVSSTSGGQGAVIHSNPVVTATFSDESGINISDAGIGHKMTILLDDTKLYVDVSEYYTPDIADPSRGSIAYPLHDLEPGDHHLTLNVWDNANNSTTATVDFKVGVNMNPQVSSLTTFYNRDKDQLSVKIDTDRALCSLQCRLECFDLSGKMLWSMQRKAYSSSDSSFTMTWDLNDTNGNRLQRGIYNMRAIVTSEDGLSTTASKKIAIPAK